MPPTGPAIIRPVILCGGAGTRLWPLSRQQSPKQFLKLVGDQSLLRQTLERVRGSRFAPALIVSGKEQADLVERELRDDGLGVEAILLEPVARNTAAAAALAASWLKSSGADELMLLMPSDHVIGDERAFLDGLERAVPHAANGSIVTFGAQPTEPNTQYGYIEARSDEGRTDGSYAIARFHEKPDAERARQYLSTGRFFWNCGIFLARASTILEEMQRHQPESSEAISVAVEQASTDGRLVRPATAPFARAANISIDYAIMEKTDRGIVVPVTMEWSDVGAWDAVWKLGTKDANGNVTNGPVVTLDTHNSLVRADGATRIAVIGLDNVAVIAVDGAILVARMDRAAEVKQVLGAIDAAPLD